MDVVSEENQKPKYAAPALSKGLDILELLAGQKEALGLKEIGDLLGRQKSEIFRMLNVLVERGYIQHSEQSEKYSITMKLLGVAHSIPHINRLISTTSLYQKQLASKIGQSCHIVIVQGHHAVVVAQQDCDMFQRYSVQVGAKLPFLNSCSGSVLLAFSEPKVREHMLSAKIYKSADIKKFEKRVPEILEKGFVEFESPIIEGVRDIGFPLYDYTGRVVASFTVPYLVYRDGSNPVGYEQVITEIKTTTDQVSKALGFEQ